MIHATGDANPYLAVHMYNQRRPVGHDVDAEELPLFK
jgi:hypothetical protein